MPTADDEIAAIIPGDGSEDHSDHRDIVLRLHAGGALKRISHLHPSYACLHYVLLFPNGEDGWHINIPSQPGPQGQRRTPKVTQRSYYAHHLHVRPGEQPALFWGGRLLQQFSVDGWASIEQSMLNWVRHHQKELRADVYQGLRDAAVGDQDQNLNLAEHGRRVILPSSHTGSERYMDQLFQDSMAICCFFCRPDIFLTMTANPEWDEIQEALLTEAPPGNQKQTAADRPDIVVRVFEEKKKALLQDIKAGVFGKVVAMVHTIEFQKRGLPHMHLLIFLDGPDKIRTAEDVDSIVSAQIPDPVTQPALYDVITKSMVHGPCGDKECKAKCMADGKCTKHFPKDFCEQTVYSENGYPLYACPNNGCSFEKRVHGKRCVFDNRDVVPYNPYLTAKYKCHINVEICASVEAVKYIHKYIYKGYDRTTIEIGSDQQRDEVKEYLDARFISAAESLWHIFEFAMHAESPNVCHLSVHLEDQNLIYYNPDDDVNDVLDRASGNTELTAWFDANRQYPDAHNTLYQDFPWTWVYVKKTKKWKPRERGAGAIGRMYFASPSQGERFYIRLLLTSVTGAISFKDLRTVNGVECDSYKSACLALGLLRDDQEWIQCLREAGDMQTGSTLRWLFAIILLHCYPTSPEALWNQFKDKICDDLRRKLSNIPAYQNRQFTDDQVHGYSLYLLETILRKSDKSLANYPPMPLAPQGPAEGERWEDTQPNYILAEQHNYDIDQLKTIVERNLGWFNLEQCDAFDTAMGSVNEKLGNIIFIHSAGGCGKTLVCNTIAAAVCSQEKIALCVASSGIAALLLEGGCTAHSRFKIPLDIFETSIANIDRNYFMFKVLELTEVIVWDEVPMQHKYAIDAVDRMARDLLKKDQPFGGITVVFGGDF